MDASTIDTFVGDYWDRFAAYWNTIPSHVRIIIMFLITRIIARALTPKPPTKKGAVKEIASLAEYQSRIAHAGNVKGKITVVDYTAVWCGPCRAIAPRFADLSVRYADVDFLKVDVDKVKGASKEADIRCYPTFQFFKGGEKVAEHAFTARWAPRPPAPGRFQQECSTATFFAGKNPTRWSNT